MPRLRSFTAMFLLSTAVTFYSVAAFAVSPDRAEDTSATPQASHSPSRVTLQGILHLGTFFGPPGFGENPEEDSVEESWYLQLPNSLADQLAQQGAAALLPAQFDGELLFFVQVVPKLTLTEMKGQLVQLTGTLFESATGHHRTPLLLEATQGQVFSALHRPHSLATQK